MARQRRHIEIGITYHLISRFVDREWFIRTEDERDLYLKLLGRALLDSDWRLLSYAIMSNHVHLGAVAGEQPLAAWIRRVHAPFADTMNRAHNRIGVMFVRGPKAFPVAPESFPHLVSYIHNNPVRAGLCAAAAGSTWTSHRAYVGEVPAPRWLHVGEGLTRAGFDSRHAFELWTNDPARAQCDAFTEEHYEQEAHETLRDARVSRKSATDRTAEAIVVATAEQLEITPDQIRSKSRGEREVFGRLVAVQCALAAGVSGCAIADALHLSQQRVSAMRRERPSREITSLCVEISRRVGRVGAQV